MTLLIPLRIWLELIGVCELPPLESGGFLFQGIPIGFSTSLKSRSSCGTMFRSLLISALYVPEIERFMCYHDHLSLIGQHISIYYLLEHILYSKKICQHSFSGVSTILFQGVRFIPHLKEWVFSTP
jgi:hypothetical protein